MRHDGRACHVPLVLLGERAVDLLQRVLVRDDLAPRVLRQRAQHEVERSAQVLGLVVSEADDAAGAQDDPRRDQPRPPPPPDIAPPPAPPPPAPPPPSPLPTPRPPPHPPT